MTPIERAARALCLIDDVDPDASLSGDKQNFRWMEYAAVFVKPVLRAIREPSGDMLDAAYKTEIEFRTTMGNLERGVCDGDGVWQAMIDAALAEG